MSDQNAASRVDDARAQILAAFDVTEDDLAAFDAQTGHAAARAQAEQDHARFVRHVEATRAQAEAELARALEEATRALAPLGKTTRVRHRARGWAGTVTFAPAEDPDRVFVAIDQRGSGVQTGWFGWDALDVIPCAPA